MNFISIEFIVFFMSVSALFFTLPSRLRWILLLAASYFFYARWNASYLILIVFSTFVDYVAARGIKHHQEGNESMRRLLLGTSISVNLGVLFIFKYFNFFADSIAASLSAFGVPVTPVELQVLLPVGISFYTFQSMSYTIDVFRGKLEPEHHFGIFATYVAFFPQLVAGPIERAGNMLPQFHRERQFDYDRLISGGRLILWGAFKKVAIADYIAIYVNSVYDSPELFDGPVLIMATVFFAFQIYCDFSGYSDIAIGTARILGFDLMENFRQPYFAQSMREFWRRWHISLSTWFRDYVYIPLGGSRVAFSRVLLNLMIVFVVSGLWHGANWTFVIWGFIHGGILVLETLFDRLSNRDTRKTARRPLSVLAGVAFTFSITCVAWVFFRANSLGDATYILTNLLTFQGGTTAFLPYGWGWTDYSFLNAIFLIGVLLVMDFTLSRGTLDGYFEARPALVRYAFYSVLVGFVIAGYLSSFSSSEAFIYFQF